MNTINSHHGAVLPTILSVLALMLIMSTHLSDAIMTQHKTNYSQKAQLKAESLSDFALRTSEQRLLSLETRPLLVTTTRPLTSINEIDFVWATNLPDYDLTITENPLADQPLDWTNQPSSWWQTYGLPVTRNEVGNSPAITTQTAYSIIEEYQQDFSGSDLGQASQHYSSPSQVIYQVTTRADSGQYGNSRLRTLVAKRFRE